MESPPLVVVLPSNAGAPGRRHRGQMESCREIISSRCLTGRKATQVIEVASFPLMAGYGDFND
jgi:hypothetical protein